MRPRAPRAPDLLSRQSRLCVRSPPSLAFNPDRWTASQVARSPPPRAEQSLSRTGDWPLVETAIPSRILLLPPPLSPSRQPRHGLPLHRRACAARQQGEPH